MSAHAPREGKKLFGGIYRLAERLGQGGTSIIYRAQSMETQEWVALKILKVDEGGESASHMLSEVMLSSRVSHPNVIEILDFGIDDSTGCLYIAMGLLEGAPLDAWLSRHGRMSEREALELVRGPIAGLAEAHRLGVVHRDIKPANLFITISDDERPALVVLDFGISGTKGNDLERIEMTPRYAAPELIEHSQVLPAGDVYQLGLTIAEMIMGAKVVPHGSSRDALIAHLVGLSLDPACFSAPLFEVLSRAIARQPEDRYASCAELLVAIDAVLMGMGGEPRSLLDELSVPELDGPAENPTVNAQGYLSTLLRQHEEVTVSATKALLDELSLEHGGLRETELLDVEVDEEPEDPFLDGMVEAEGVESLVLESDSVELLPVFDEPRERLDTLEVERGALVKTGFSGAYVAGAFAAGGVAGALLTYLSMSLI